VKAERETRSESMRAGGGDEYQPAGEPDEHRSNRLIHRVYTVFNARQIEGIPEATSKERLTFEMVESGERILQNSGAIILHDQADGAFYNRLGDRIHLPPKHAFKDAPAYYGTALHQLAHNAESRTMPIRPAAPARERPNRLNDAALWPLFRVRNNAHWSGHPSRLNRATLNESYRFGDISYAKEELRAELASVFLAAERGIPHDPEQHAAYVGSWINLLKQDKHEIFRYHRSHHHPGRHRPDHSGMEGLAGRPPDPSEGGEMKTIWAIVAGLGAMLVLSFVMVFVTMPRRAIAHKTISPPCVCNCMRKAGGQ
jgi:antirestriction protein ArdC